MTSLSRAFYVVWLRVKRFGPQYASCMCVSDWVFCICARIYLYFTVTFCFCTRSLLALFVPFSTHWVVIFSHPRVIFYSVLHFNLLVKWRSHLGKSCSIAWCLYVDMFGVWWGQSKSGKHQRWLFTRILRIPNSDQK